MSTFRVTTAAVSDAANRMGGISGHVLDLHGWLQHASAGREDRAPMRTAARRFGVGTLVAIAVLVITEALMASLLHRWSDSTPQVKLGLMVVGVLIGFHFRRPESHVLDATILLVSLAIVWLGIVVAG